MRRTRAVIIIVVNVIAFTAIAIWVLGVPNITNALIWAGAAAVLLFAVGLLRGRARRSDSN